MALSTFGTNAQTTLSALSFKGGASSQLPADFVSLNALIKDDYTGVVFNSALGLNGQLVIPRRGVLKVYPGDYVAVDSNGWPILVSGLIVGSGSQWVHSP